MFIPILKDTLNKFDTTSVRQNSTQLSFNLLELHSYNADL